MALPPIKVKIGADTGELDAALGSAERSFSDLSNSADKAGMTFDGLQAKARALGRGMFAVGAGVAAVGAAAFGIVANTARAGQEIDNLARISGTGVEEFQRLAFAAKAVGIEQDKLADIYRDTNDRVGEFLQTGSGPMVDFFENIAPKVGVTADQFARLSGPEALQLYVSSLEAAGLSQQEMTFYMEALAGDASQLIPLLADSGAEMQRLGDIAAETGGIMDSEAIAASRDFNEQMGLLKAGVGAAGTSIGMALLPMALELVTALNENVIPAVASMSDNIKAAGEWFAGLGAPVQAAAGIFVSAFGTGSPLINSIITITDMFRALTSEDGPILALKAIAPTLVNAWNSWGDETVAVIGATADWIVARFDELVAWLEMLPERFMEMGRNIIAGLWEGLQAAWEEFSILAMVEGWGDAIASGFASMLGIQSPSRVFMEFGQNIGEGLARGINSTFGMVRQAVGGLTSATVADALTMADSVVGALGQMFQGSKPIAIAQSLINTFQAITEALKLPPPMNFIQAAAAAAAGFAAVRNIVATRPGSSPGGKPDLRQPRMPAGGGGGQPAEMPTQTVRFDFGNNAPMGADQMVAIINDAYDRGVRIRGVVA